MALKKGVGEPRTAESGEFNRFAWLSRDHSEEQHGAISHCVQKNRVAEMSRSEVATENTPPNPPDESAQHVSEKIPFGRIIPPFFPSKVQNLTVFSITCMIRIRFFGLGEEIQN